MRDLMMEFYNAFKNDSVISKHVSSIRFSDYPNANDITNPVIVIDDLSTPSPGD